jgi:hypothetical protein
MKTSKSILFSFALAALSVTTALAQPFPGATWTLDENGHATLTYQSSILSSVTGVLQVEPLSGITGLYYNLGTPSQQGDLLILEPTTFETNDMLRFDGHGGVFFFSDLEPNDPNPDLADVPQIPLVIQGNSAVIIEVGPEGNNGALWAPPPGFAGDDTSGLFPGIQYNIISDIPEPNSLGLLLIGAAVWRMKSRVKRPISRIKKLPSHLNVLM